MWKPHALLCKRYNIAEPFGGLMEDQKRPKKRTKLSIFNYLETSINRKEDFQTPVIVSKPIAESVQLIQPTEEINRPIEQKNVTADEKSFGTLQKKLTTKSFTPKTDLEKEVIEGLNKSVIDKKELFKSIFSDSDSDEESSVKERQEKANEESKANSAPLVANLLRNNSPPRGIFKALFAAPEKCANKTTKESDDIRKDCFQAEKIQFKAKASRESSGKVEEDSNTYGPALPTQLNKNEMATENNTDLLSETLDAKLLKIFNKQKIISNKKVGEIWIEKSKSLQSSDDVTDSSSEDSDDTDNSVGNNTKGSGKLNKKKKMKKSKKKNLLETKHRKHKSHKVHKKTKKHGKKKKTHKKNKY